MKSSLLKEVHQLFLGEDIQSTDLHQLVLVVIHQLLDNSSKRNYTQEERFAIIEPVLPKDITFKDFENLVSNCFMAHALHADIKHTKPVELTKDDFAYFKSIEHEQIYYT